MSLGDFSAELRDDNIHPDVIDAILDYMINNNWVWVWRHRDTEENWVSVYEVYINDDAY